MPRTSCTNPKLAFQERMQELREAENEAICPECGETAEWVDCRCCDGDGLDDLYQRCPDCDGNGGHYFCPFGCASEDV